MLARLVQWLIRKLAPGMTLKIYREPQSFRRRLYRSRLTSDCLAPEIVEGSELTFDLNTEPRVGDWCLVRDAGETLSAEQLIVKKLVNVQCDGREVRCLYASDRLPLIKITADHGILGALLFALVPSTPFAPVDSEISSRANAENSALERELREARARGVTGVAVMENPLVTRHSDDQRSRRQPLPQ